MLVELADEVKQQRTAGLAEWQIPEFVENHDVRVHEPVGEVSSFAGLLLELQRVHQLDRGEEANPATQVFDGVNREGRRQMRLAGARAAN